MRKLLRLAVMLVGMANFAAAQREVAATVSLATLRVPASARGHFEKARQAALAGRTNVYEREIAKALDIDPEFAEAYVLRASQELLRRDFEAALNDSYDAERLDSGVVCIRLVRASALNGLRRFGQAWALLATMVGAEGQLWSATYEKTRAAVGLGDVAASLRWSAETMALAPVDLLDEAKVLRGDALELASRYDEAALIWRDYLASPHRQVYRAQVLVALARAESASRRQEVAGLRR